MKNLVRTILATALLGSTASVASAESVTMRLPWILNVQGAGYVMAKEKGFYKEEGLDVTILPGGPNLNSAALVASGADTFGSNDVIAVIQGAAQGMALKVVGGCFQKHPGGLIVRSDAGIETPKDLEGKSMAYNEGGPWTLTRAMLAAAGVDLAKINTVVSPSIELIAENKVQAKTGFTVNEPISLQQKGVETRVFLPSDYGVQTYAETVFTSPEFATTKPEVVKAFMKATRKGYDYAYANKQETVDTVLKLNPQLDAKQQAEQLARQESYVYTDYTRQNGACAFEGSVIAGTDRMLRDFAGLTAAVDVEAIYSTEYLTK